MDARCPCRFRVAAYRVDGASDPVIPQEERREQEDRTCDPNGDGHAKEVLRAQIDVGVGQVIDGAPTHDSHLNAGQQDQHGQREDEGIEAQLDHHEAVKGSDDKSDQQDDRDPDKWVPIGAQALAVLRDDQPGPHHRRQAVRRLKGQIKLTGQQDQALGDHNGAQCS